jgi:hypothetical protein
VDGAAVRCRHCAPLECGLPGKAGSRRELEVRDTGRASAITGAIWAGFTGPVLTYNARIGTALLQRVVTLQPRSFDVDEAESYAS